MPIDRIQIKSTTIVPVAGSGSPAFFRAAMRPDCPPERHSQVPTYVGIAWVCFHTNSTGRPWLKDHAHAESAGAESLVVSVPWATPVSTSPIGTLPVCSMVGVACSRRRLREHDFTQMASCRLSVKNHAHAESAGAGPRAIPIVLA